MNQNQRGWKSNLTALFTDIKAKRNPKKEENKASKKREGQQNKHNGL